MPRRAKRFDLKNVFFACLATLLGLMLIEGFCSMLLVSHGFLTRSTRITAERSHTEYDALLGWVNKPNVYLSDFYEEGADVQTNSQGFRNRVDFPREVPTGKIRFICSGDSFTFGYGVGNDKNWCHRLSVLHSGIETVNMGQGGYGGGQAYLWYRRDGVQIEHDVHLFVFISAVLNRMPRASFRGYGKPVLALQDGALVTKNVPVPETGYFLPALTERFKYLKQTSVSRVLLKGISLFPGPEPPDPEPVVSELLRELRALHQENGTTLILVFLPTQIDHASDYSLAWRDLVHSESKSLGIPFINLVSEFRELDGNTVQEMFRADGHYTIMGNQLIAERLLDQLKRGPVADLLEHPSETLEQAD